MEYIQKQTCVAQTPEICQRFTFEKVGTGDNAYYHILPYLRLQTDAANSDTIEIKGSYRSEYRLAVVNGVVKVVQIPVTNGEAEDPTSGRWLLQQTAGGKYLIKNVSTGTYLNMENNAVCLTQQQPRSTLWELKAISLAMEKDYQQYTNTCGAASGKMIVNYLTDDSLSDHDFLEIYNEKVGHEYSFDLDTITTTVNSCIDSQTQYVCSSTFYDDLDLQKILSISLNKQYPVVINNKPFIEHGETVGYWYASVQGAGGHYYVVKGIYYDCGVYHMVINETHYKYGAEVLGRYVSLTETTPKNRICNNIGGRDLILNSSTMHTVFANSNRQIMYIQ